MKCNIKKFKKYYPIGIKLFILWYDICNIKYKYSSKKVNNYPTYEVTQPSQVYLFTALINSFQ